MNTYTILSKCAQSIIDALIETDEYYNMLANEITHNKKLYKFRNSDLIDVVTNKIAEILSTDYLEIYQIYDTNEVEHVNENGETVVETVVTPKLDAERLSEEVNHILSDAELLDPVIDEIVTLTDKELHECKSVVLAKAVEDYYTLDLGTDEEREQEAINKLSELIKQVVDTHIERKHNGFAPVEPDTNNGSTGDGDDTVVL